MLSLLLLLLATNAFKVNLRERLTGIYNQVKGNHEYPSMSKRINFTSRKLDSEPTPNLDLKLDVDGKGNDEEEEEEQDEEDFDFLNKYKDKYELCLDDLEDKEFLLEESRDKCVGKDLEFITLDYEYELGIMQSLTDTQIRKLFISSCYSLAGDDYKFANGCNLEEQDALEMLWQGLDFFQIIKANQNKYVKTMGKMPLNVFISLRTQLQSFSKEFFKIQDYYNETKDNLKTYFDILIKERIAEINEFGYSKKGLKAGMKKDTSAVPYARPYKYKSGTYFLLNDSFDPTNLSKKKK